MTVIKVNFEIGHEATLRSKKTPEGFTHDWEVFVRGQEGASISHFVEKVVFYLHQSFPKPKRVVKEPPFSIKESGYGGFIFPIEIYLKNKDEPKKIKFTYNFTLEQSGFLKDRYIFHNPNDDFKKKLLKGGGIIVSNNAFYTNPDQESRSQDSFTDDKQVASKSKSSSDGSKKHKVKEHKDDVPIKASSFETLFGAPIQKPSKVSPDPKKSEKNISSAKSDKKDKDRSSSDKVKSKHEHKEAKPDKIKVKEDKDKIKSDKPEKIKSHKEERSKEKSSKRPSECPPSPESAKKRCPSPSRKPSPIPRSSSASSLKEEYKPPKIESLEQKKIQKPEEKPSEYKAEKEKKKKEKKSHDRDKERKEKKEHKKESHKSKEPVKEIKEVVKEIPKVKELPKEKDIQIIKEKPAKLDKPVNKFSIENLKKTPQDNTERFEENKAPPVREKDPERKHKHKKKDKKRDESREKHKDSNREKKHKHDKVRDTPVEKTEPERRETPVPKEKPIPEPASPISIDTASQCSSKSGIAKTSQIGAEDINSSHSDSEESVVEEDMETKSKTENPSPEPEKEHIPSPEPEPVPEPVLEPPPQKEKSKKHKDKSSKREEKKRKRKAAEEEEAENRKVAKLNDSTTSKTESEHGETSGTTSAETKVQDNGVSSSLGEDAEPGELSPDYMVQLRGLQQRIMTINSNEELERVVNLIAETGRYEVTTQTFDFDLCLLDRSTVQQLMQLVGC